MSQPVELNSEELSGLLEGMGADSSEVKNQPPAIHQYKTAIDSVKKSLLAGWGNLNETLSLKARIYEGISDIVSADQLTKNYLQSQDSQSQILIEYTLTGDGDGKFIIIFPQADFTKIANLILGRDESKEEIPKENTAQEIKRIKDTMIPFIISSLAHINEKNQIEFNYKLSKTISIPENPYIFDEKEYLTQSMHFHLQNMVDSSINFIISKSIIEKIHYLPAIESNLESNLKPSPTKEQIKEAIIVDSTEKVEQAEKVEEEYKDYNMENTVNDSDQINIQDISLPPIPPSQTTNAKNKNIDLLLDVKMNLTVELGRTDLSIRDVLDLGEGSIIELEKLVGEPIDLLVHDKLIARGEVVVIDEHFGVRITDIISSRERLQKLKNVKST